MTQFIINHSKVLSLHNVPLKNHVVMPHTQFSELTFFGEVSYYDRLYNTFLTCSVILLQYSK